MKKTITILSSLFLMFLWACDSISQEETPSVPKTTTAKDYRTIDEAILIANKAINEFYPANSRSDNRVIDKQAIEVVQTCGSRSGNPDTLMYILNFEDNMGYAVISASHKGEALLAITEHGHYDPYVESENEGLNNFMSFAKDYVNNIIFNPNDTIDPFLPDNPNPGIGLSRQVFEYDTLRKVRVYPRLRTGCDLNWGQNYPEGSCCPNFVSGCGPTAIAMVAAHYQDLKSLKLTYPGHTMDVIDLDWSKIRLYNGRMSFPDMPDVEETVSPGAINSIAHLCRQIGEWVDADYSNPGGTGISSPGSATIGLRRIMPNRTISSVKDFTTTGLESAIIDGCVLMFGLDSTTKMGHVWVADGCSVDEVKTRIYSVSPSGEKKLKEETISSKSLVHLNWGFYGKDNGYFFTRGFYTLKYAYDFDYTQREHTNYSFEKIQYVGVK